MNNSKIATLTNRLAMGAVLALLYWVFIFISISVFGFKIFRENMTQAYYLSILGILAVLIGAVFLNVMANMSRIADSVSSQGERVRERTSLSRKWSLIVFLSFPVIFGLLVAGDYRSVKIKQKHLISSANSLVSENLEIFNQLANYDFSREYLVQASRNIAFISKIDKKFPTAKIIVSDKADGKNILMSFSNWSNLSSTKDGEPDKSSYVFSTTEEEREYLFSALAGKHKDVRFSASDGNYELYYPVQSAGKILILYLSDRQTYGKSGS